MSEPVDPVDQVNPGDPAWPPFVHKWVMPFLSDPDLWAVTFAVFVHAAVVVAVAMLAVSRGQPVALAPLSVLVIASFGVLRHDLRVSRGIGRIGVAILLAWLLSFLFALLGWRTGVI